jgi:hypothetical protein
MKALSEFSGHKTKQLVASKYYIIQDKKAGKAQIHRKLSKECQKCPSSTISEKKLNAKV